MRSFIQINFLTVCSKVIVCPYNLKTYMEGTVKGKLQLLKKFKPEYS